MFQKFSYRNRVIDILSEYFGSGRPGRDLWGLFDFEIECLRRRKYSEYEAAFVWALNHAAFLIRYSNVEYRCHMYPLIEGVHRIAPMTGRQEMDMLQQVRGMALAQGNLVDISEIDKWIEYETDYKFKSIKMNPKKRID